MLHKCIRCNKTFIPPSGNLKKGMGIYCSRECCNLDKKGKPSPFKILYSKNCIVCTKEFSVTGHHKERKCCSPECFIKNRRGRPSPKKNQIPVICTICKITFTTNRYAVEKSGRKCCSRECYYQSKKGKPTWNKGGSFPQFQDENSPEWKGDNVGYIGLHQWVKKHLGKPDRCDYILCKYPRKNSGGRLLINPKRYEWANKSQLYKRDLEDWIRLCPSCHRLYDSGKIVV